MARARSRFSPVGVVLLAGALCGSASAAPKLFWHVETDTGTVIETRRGDLPFNPASVTKAATTLWALETLGPDYRYFTRFLARGTVDYERGRLVGDLVVQGGDDPDFHVENAWLVARALNSIGIRSVEGSVLVDSGFNFGWEGGAPLSNDEGRTRLMARRLRDALDPARWDRASKRSVAAFLARLGPSETIPASTRVTSRGFGATTALETDTFLVAHRSNPLHTTIKRFNTWSNNDIERLGALLGSSQQLTIFLRERLGQGVEGTSFSSLSGLGVNRMTARTAVAMFRALRTSAESHGIELEDLLPVLGCDAGTLASYPRLSERMAGRITAKTGTLTSTDGGVSVLAGRFVGPDGGRIFCVAAVGTGSRTASARRAIEDVLLRLTATAVSHEAPPECLAPRFSDSDVTVERRHP